MRLFPFIFVNRRSFTYLNNWTCQDPTSRLKMCWNGHDDYETKKKVFQVFGINDINDITDKIR